MRDALTSALWLLQYSPPTMRRSTRALRLLSRHLATAPAAQGGPSAVGFIGLGAMVRSVLLRLCLQP